MGATLALDDTGAVTATPEATRRLAAAAGMWRLLPTAGDLLALQRMGTPAADTAKARHVSICGSLRDGVLPSIINLIQMSHADGALEVMSGDAHKTLYFRQGTLLCASTNEPQYRIGDILLKQGRITRTQLDDCLRDVAGGQRIGRALVNAQIMTTAEIYAALREQAVSIFCSTLLLRDGSYALVAPLDMRQVNAMLRLDVQGLLLEGLRRVDELALLRGIIPNDNVVLRRVASPREPTATIGPDAVHNAARNAARDAANAARLLAAVNGTRTLAAIMAEASLDEFTATRIAAELVQRGLVVIGHPDHLERAVPVEPAALGDDPVATIVHAYDQALRRIYAAVDEPVRDELRSHMQTFIAARPHFGSLFDGIDLAGENPLPGPALAANVARMPEDERLTALQLGMNELLFFALFAAGDDLDNDTELGVQDDVAHALEHLPGATPAGPR